MITCFVRPFSEIGIGDRVSVGGKGASLGELTRAGIPVPPGFVVDTACFRVFLDTVDADHSARSQLEALSNLDLITAEGNNMRQRIMTAVMPPQMAEAISAAYDSLSDGPVAVRSSATGEDGEDASFAGLQDTYLWLTGNDAVLHHVQRCWASLYSTESLSYRRRLGIAEDGLAMGVVVQRMVDAALSGVMFTRSPTTGDRSVIVVEGSYGLGSCVVSGEVTPDKYVINKVTGEIMDRAVSVKMRQHVPDARNGGVIDEPVADQLQSVTCLSDAQLAELAAIAKRVERHYGRPQDIEWAIARSGDVFILQSRPETVWSRRDPVPVAKQTATPFDHVFAVFGGNR